jgi:hypothetical protein
MQKLIVWCNVLLVALLLITMSVGCQQQPQSEEPPTLAIMVESNVVEAGTSFMVSGSNFKPNEYVFVEFEYRFGDKNESQTGHGAAGKTVISTADEDGSVHPVIDIPDDIVPGDYEVKISTGSSLNIKDRQLFKILPIRIQGKPN